MLSLPHGGRNHDGGSARRRRGKRLGDLTAHTPKPLLDIAGSPLISHIVDALASAGLANFIVVTGYLSEAIEQWRKRIRATNPGSKSLPLDNRN